MPMASRLGLAHNSSPASTLPWQGLPHDANANNVGNSKRGENEKKLSPVHHAARTLWRRFRPPRWPCSLEVTGMSRRGSADSVPAQQKLHGQEQRERHQL